MYKVTGIKETDGKEERSQKQTCIPITNYYFSIKVQQIHTRERTSSSDFFRRLKFNPVSGPVHKTIQGRLKTQVY